MKFNSKQKQDQFVDLILKQDSGFFVDFGAYKPIYANNTYYFEQLGWNGLSFEIQNFSREWKQTRKTPCVFSDVTNLDLSKVFIEYKVPEIIDYMSIDIDDSTLKCLKNIPFDNYSVKVLTVEHDFYKNKNTETRENIRKILSDNGYIMVCKDIHLTPNKPFEDWWVNPKLVEESAYSELICENKYFQKLFNTQ